jgi:alkylation response protein AidB-like acyl-CoA dehydrogenase
VTDTATLPMTPDEHSAKLAARLADARGRLAGLRLGDGFDPAVPAALVASGLQLAPVPEAAGGLGIGPRAAVELLASLGAIDGSAALGFAMHVHVVGGMAESPGWPAGLRETLYDAVRHHGALLNSAGTEDAGGSPARGAVPETAAVEGTDGTFRLTGEKSWTTWLPALRFALVTARIVPAGAAPAAPQGGPDAPDGPPEVAVFVVDLDGRGVTRLPGFDALGMRGSASGRLRLDGAVVPAERVVARRRVDEPDPRGVVPSAWFGFAIAGVYLGIGEGARSEVVRWAIDRRPGDGSTAVADLPSVQVRLGRLDAALRAARIVVLDVAARWEATDPADRAGLMADVALAKLSATGAAAQATDEALRIAGGPGFLDGPLERAFRDARAGLINPPLEDVALAGFARTLVDRQRGG